MKRFFWILLLVLAGCESAGVSTEDGPTMPAGAADVRDVGNGWVTFVYNGDCVLFHRITVWGIESYTESMTTLSDSACATLPPGITPVVPSEIGPPTYGTPPITTYPAE